MGKRRSFLDARQLGFSYEPPKPASADGDLAGSDRKVAAVVARALKDDPRSRHVVAAEMSSLLGEDVSKLMLDAYASEARDTHNIPAHRLLALIGVTERFDLLDVLVRPIGAAVLVGDEVRTARIGHLEAQKRLIETELRHMKSDARPIDREPR